MKPTYVIPAIVILGSGVLVLLAGCEPKSYVVEQPTVPRVVTTFYPLAEFAHQVGDEYVDVLYITPPGTEPHDFEPTPRDVTDILSADLFIINGSGMDPWAQDIAHDGDVRMLVMNEYVDQIAAQAEDEHEDEHAEEADDHGHEEDDHDHADASGMDPHFWLDPIRAKEVVMTIADELAELSPEHAQQYRANAQKYAQELATLDAEYRAGLSSCETGEFVVSHAAFAYLADRYDLDMHAIAGLSPDDEPTPRRLAELTDFVRSEGIDVILFETLVSPKVAETLASEVGAETAVLNPLEGLTEEQAAAGMDYLSVMRENLRTLQLALKCS